MATRGFIGRRPAGDKADRLPPGQHETADFPILQFGPTPAVDQRTWTLTLKSGPRPLMRWRWDDLAKLPHTKWHGDIHCVTTWSKFDTSWEGVLFDDLLAEAGIHAPTSFVLAHSADGYSTNVALTDLTGGKAMVATRYDGQAIEPDHGGPVRLLVPHLYFWKSAKWLTGLQFTTTDQAGFWELRGYHMRGDPWREQRYSDDP